MPQENQLSKTPSAPDIIKDWRTIEQFCAEFTNIPEPTLRWQLTQRHRNGLAPHVRMIGKQRFISISGYAGWLAQPSTH
ncbi:hypothetical protein [Zhongshania marina]|uniref:hypothetical protein n=1 Tax=Zhongshania marina TaxID=2304603 RepID=UPI000F44A795